MSPTRHSPPETKLYYSLALIAAADAALATPVDESRDASAAAKAVHDVLLMQAERVLRDIPMHQLGSDLQRRLGAAIDRVRPQRAQRGGRDA